MKLTKSQRRELSEAGVMWAEAMAQQFRYIADQGKRAESRRRAARGRAMEALRNLRCVMASLRPTTPPPGAVKPVFITRLLEIATQAAPASCPHPVRPMTECDVCAQTGIWAEAGKDGAK